MIRTDIKNLSSCRKELTIVMDKADLEPIREKQVKEVQKQAEFPGFRRGKAPMNLIKQNYSQMIESYTLEAALDEALRRSAEENKLAIVGHPEAKKLEFNDEGNLVSVIEVDTFPEIGQVKFGPLDLVRDIYQISDQAVDDAIAAFRRRGAIIVNADGPGQMGNILTLDMQELGAGDVVIIGKKYDDIVVRLGEGKFDAQLEEQLVGLQAGDEKIIEKHYADDFPQAEFSGKTERYKVNIKKIQQENLPELNEEFLRSVNANLKTFDDLKLRTREQLEADYENMAENRINDDLAQYLIQENPFDLPDAIVEDYLDRMVKDLKARNPKLGEDEIRKHHQGQAIFTIKWHYLREQLTQQENIVVTDEDLRAYFEEFKDEKVREIYKNNEQLMLKAKEGILERKIDEFLLGQAHITENIINL
jgi:trigger factor